MNETQTEVPTRLDVPWKTVVDWVAKRESDSDFAVPSESRQHFDIWTFQTAAGAFRS